MVVPPKGIGGVVSSRRVPSSLNVWKRVWVVPFQFGTNSEAGGPMSALTPRRRRQPAVYAARVLSRVVPRMQAA